MDFSRYLQAARQGCVDAWHASKYHGKDSPSPPPAPDYRGAAQTTSEGSVQAALVNNLLNLRNTYTPLGSQTFQQTGSTTVPAVGGQSAFDIPQYEQRVNMTPEGQQLYDEQLRLSQGLLGLGNTSLDQTRASLGSPQELGSVQDIADQSYKLQTDRLDPQWNARSEQQRTMLANQGLAPGGEAYTNAMRDFENARNDAYGQARLSSISTMPQTYQLSTAARMQPLTELNAIRSGAQPQMPQFQAVPAAGGAQGPNMLGAEQAQAQYGQNLYNQQVAGNNSMASGLFGIGGSIAGALPWAKWLV